MYRIYTLAIVLLGVMASTSPAEAQRGARCCATRGYLGLSFDGPNVEERRNNERVIRFLDYPRIALVEPGSPAERAGVAEGDTLLALNGSDVRSSELELTALLVPGRRLSVRVRREGRPLDFRVVVAPTPAYVISRMMPMPEVPGMPPLPSMPAMTAMPEWRALSAMSATPLDGVAGARLESVSQGLGRALGTKYGVLVLQSAPGSPAYESGLRDGDVILRADQLPVRSVSDLRQTLEEADGDKGVRLVLLREHKQREITLRW